MKAGAGLSIGRMLELGGVSRSSFYRFDPEGPAGAERDMDLRDAIQRIALQWPSYGRPRITAELRRRGWTVNPKRLDRLMRADNLLCLRRRKFVITTDSDHSLAVYPNRARELVLTGSFSTAVGRRYHLHPARVGVRLSGRDSGRLLAPRHRLGAGPHVGRTLAPGRTRQALAQRSPPPAWCITPTAACSTPRTTTSPCFRPTACHQHEPAGQSLRQRHLREVPEDAQARGGVPSERSCTWPRACSPLWVSSRSITTNACTRRSAICRRLSSRHN